jgi:hypothetical protein
MRYKSYTGNMHGVPSTVHLEFFARASVKTADQEDVSSDSHVAIWARSSEPDRTHSFSRRPGEAMTTMISSASVPATLPPVDRASRSAHVRRDTTVTGA